MSARGTAFLDRWIANNIHIGTTVDEAVIRELSHKLVADARLLGIRRGEIDEEVDNMDGRILNAIGRCHTDLRRRKAVVSRPCVPPRSSGGQSRGAM
jgi:hypothetical protein